MVITKLYLKNFRQFKNNFFDFQSNLNLVIGCNTIGKSTILESLFFLSHGESFKTCKNVEMINFDSQFGQLSVYLQNKKEVSKIELTLTSGLFNGKKKASKLYKINNQPKRKKDFLRNLISISFRPEDLRLIEGSPSRRREYFNLILKITDPQYESALLNYENNLKKRNCLLFQIREKQMPLNLLKFYNQQMLKSAKIIYQARDNFCQFLNQFSFPIKLKINYLSSIFNQERLDIYQNKEILVSHTLIGPQKDDFEILYQFQPNQQLSIASFGSRAQQRLATLFLKIGEFYFLKQIFNRNPLILLDDILSELDIDSQRLLFPLLSLSQTIITSSNLETEQILKENNFNFNLINLLNKNLS